MSEGVRIHISDTTKHLLDKLGGFRCEYRGVLDLGVSSINIIIHTNKTQFLSSYYPEYDIISFLIQARQCQLETFWLLGWEEDVDDVSPGHRSNATDANNKNSHN